MGYRHIMIAEGDLPEGLPQWFVDKYNHCIDFKGKYYWLSKGEFKINMSYRDIAEDIQKLLNDEDDMVQLVFFADEGLSNFDKIDIKHVSITPESIERKEPSGWN